VTRETLLALSKDDLLALVLAQAAQISTMAARIVALEASPNNS
jgi:hypothetical protein